MADIQAALPEKGVQYKLITCLGKSFGYLNKTQRKKAFQDMFDVLLPGGKVIVQWRDFDDQLMREREEEIQQKRGVALRRKTLPGKGKKSA